MVREIACRKTYETKNEKYMAKSSAILRFLRISIRAVKDTTVFLMLKLAGSGKRKYAEIKLVKAKAAAKKEGTP